MTGADILASFLEARRHGSAVKFHRPGPMKALSASKISTAPVFDFGHINDPSSTEMWTTKLWDELWDEYLDHPNEVRLPFAEVYYLFRYAGSSTQPSNFNLLHLQQSNAGVALQTWFWQPMAPAPFNVWALAPCERSDAGNYFYNIAENQFDTLELASYAEDARSNWTAAMDATVLLNRRQQIETTASPIGKIAIKANERRERVNLDAILPAVVVRMISRQAEGSDSSRSYGGTKQPHDRRGHWRNYKSGKKVWIRNQRIHGGSEKPRQYRVLNG